MHAKSDAESSLSWQSIIYGIDSNTSSGAPATNHVGTSLQWGAVVDLGACETSAGRTCADWRAARGRRGACKKSFGVTLLTVSENRGVS